VKDTLSARLVPEFNFPPAFSGLTFPEKVAHANRRMNEISAEMERINSDMERMSARWMPIYLRIRGWLLERLSIMSASALAFETRMCFFINGWMPSKDLGRLRERMDKSFGSRVVVEEKEMMEEDLERVPIFLKNPPYFRPFELFTSMLPLPSYTSYDPTPFIGIFFPVFFGMILGDAGYGVVLGIIACVLLKRSGRRLIRDGAQILAVSSIYAILFGILYGEFFGDLPRRFFGIEPICIERRTAVVPMIYFAVATGAAHVFLGFFLGAVASFRKKQKKEALYKLVSIIVLFAVMGVVASVSGLFPSVLLKPAVIAILFLAPLLFFAGGVLAPLELLKSIGNIISYVRIMAIGLTSVLLAFVANQLGGLTGNIVAGLVVAGLLHILNIILGVFAPTIHALRLHYVEFFSKFIEQGGKRFEPLRKEE
jgi:V/A-type H+-transporting ATPase subunit I